MGSVKRTKENMKLINSERSALQLEIDKRLFVFNPNGIDDSKEVESVWDRIHKGRV
jgi:hypothetical protein